MEDNKFNIGKLAEMVNGELDGDPSLEVTGFAAIEDALPGEITFLVNARQSELLEQTKASVVIVADGVEKYGEQTIIRVKDPYLAAAIIHGFMMERPFIAKKIHAKAYVGDNCQLGNEISIGAMAVIGERVTIGERVDIGAGVVIGDDVVIGDNVVIKPNVTVSERCIIGAHVIIHSGTVIGSDGFAYAADEKGEHIKRPQVGIVQVDDNVEIGANCCIDRAAYGVTLIKRGVKIDNLVQVAHNVTVGENSLLVAQVGIAGSSILGKNVVLGGQAAVAGHVKLGDRVMIAARGGVNKDLPEGAVIGGAPGLPIRQWAKAVAVFAKLPELQSSVRKNSKAIAELKRGGN